MQKVSHVNVYTKLLKISISGRDKLWFTLREKGPHSEFLWSVFFGIWTEYGLEKLRVKTLFTQCYTRGVTYDNGNNDSLGFLNDPIARKFLRGLFQKEFASALNSEYFLKAYVNKYIIVKSGTIFGNWKRLKKD